MYMKLKLFVTCAIKCQYRVSLIKGSRCSLFCLPYYCKRLFSSKTIFAVSSGQGKCGVAVIRVSGPDSKSVLEKVGGLTKVPEARKALLRRLKHPKTNNILDQGLILWFPGPNSFTGEDCCELQVHGGTAVVSAVLEALSVMPGLCPAQPGEFTKRAFYNNKLDLTEVEGLADLIHAETEMQRKQALHQMEGSLNRRYSNWRESLKRCIAHVEAYIDFSEDQNIEQDILQTTNKQVELLQKDIQSHLKDGRRGERTRDGVKTVIVGAPNVGKSSLLNALCERPAAIVSALPGTTRDIVSSTLDIAGFPMLLSDTAGLRHHPADMVEEEGILRAHKRVTEADLILLVIDATCYKNWYIENKSSGLDFFHFLQDYLKNISLEETILTCKNIQKMLGIDKETKNDITCLIVINKLDLIEDSTCFDQVLRKYPDSVVGVSCKDNNLEMLLDVLKSCLESLCGNPTRENASLSQARHRHHLTSCSSALKQYLILCGSEKEIDLAAHQLRQALYALGHITGHVSTEQILDVIFKEFCIGK